MALRDAISSVAFANSSSSSSSFSASSLPSNSSSEPAAVTSFFVLLSKPLVASHSVCIECRLFDNGEFDISTIHCVPLGLQQAASAAQKAELLLDFYG
jgi:hypothetical protein